MDAELNRSVPHNWKDYIKDALRVKELAMWIWKEFSNQKCKELSKKMFLATAIICLIDVITPWVLSTVFDGLNPKNLNLSAVIFGLIMFGIMIIIGRMVHYKQGTYREIIYGEKLRQLDKRTTELFFAKSLGTHIDEGTLLNEANIKKGYERILQLEDMAIGQGTQTLLNLTFCFFALWFLGWRPAALVTAMIIFYLIWTLFMNQKVMEKGIPIDEKWRNMTRFRIERWGQIERVKTNSKESDEVKELGRLFDDAINPDRKLWLWYIKQVLKREYVNHFVLLSIMFYGVFEVWHGRMTLGLLYPLFTWTSQFTNNLWLIGHFEHQINWATPSILALQDALNLPKGLTTTERPKHLPKSSPCRVEFQNVNFTYSVQPNGSKQNDSLVPVLNDISFAIEPGEKVALIGSSGAGKTTIMRLLLRYMDPTSGKIKIDSLDLRDLKLSSWLCLVGYIPQQAQIFDGTIRYNLLYGLPDSEKEKISDEELWDTIHLLKIDFGKRLTNGLDTLVGRDGIKLSGGQAQRIMIGAAVIKKPRFMVIDEATSSLDSSTEKLVQEGLKQVLTDDRGALIITHRLNTVRRICNKFIMLSENGGDKGSKIVAITSSFEKLASESYEFRSLALDQGITL